MLPRTLRHLAGVLAALTLVFLFPAAPEVAGQYFGRNAVQYERFDFEVLETEHFDLYHYDEQHETALHVARMSERWYARLSRMFDYELRGRQPFILYTAHPHFWQTTAIPGRVGEGTGGVTEPFKRRVVMPVAGPLAETDHIVGHELVHAFQFGMTGVDPTAPLVGAPALMSLPLWFIEGMAEYLSLGPNDPFTAMWMRDAIAAEAPLPSVRDLANPQRFFPYRWGHSMWAYIAGRWGDERVGQMLRAGIRTGSVQQAISTVLHIHPDTLARDWHEALRETYGPMLERTRPASEFAEPLVVEDRFNVGPAVSPDGQRMVFLSERRRFSIDMFLADATTGDVERQVTRTAMDPHFQSLEFINSAGSWAPDGERFAFAAVASGQPVVTIVEPETGRTVQEVRLRQLGELYNPTWSPDGRRIAFAGNERGHLDLYVLDLETEEVRRFTNDSYAVVHPAWSPDGRRIAFATDRFTTDLRTLRYGPYRLAALDVESGEIEALPHMEGSRHVNPQWSPDGRALYFIADPDGVSNLYRLDLATGESERLTDLQTGVSGISALSPALSVAAESGDLVFSVFEEGANHLYRIDAERIATVEPPPAEPPAPPPAEPGALPPFERVDALVADLLADAQLGLPDPVTFTERPYRAGLGLDFIAQPSFGLGISSFGSFVGAGAALFFSDMLGHHSLATQLQLQIIDGQVLEGIGALGQYLNRRNRVYWGATAGQMPFFFRSFGAPQVGQTQILFSELRFWQVERPAIAVAQYPFSEVQRVEVAAGFQQTAFTMQLRQQVFDRFSGQLIADETFDVPRCEEGQSPREELCEPAPLNQFLATAALVRDNVFHGPTGPIMGQRYRFEATPYLGTLNYMTALGDFRHYILAVEPLTLAGRLMHFGRYGTDSDDDRLQRLFLGFPSLIRGYDAGSFSLANCPPGQPIEECSELLIWDQMFGTRLGVANVEARLPLFGPLGLLSRTQQVPPIDLFGFFDAGMAWRSEEGATFADRSPVTSAGVGLRINLFGFAMAELDWVTPFDRPDRGSFITFYLVPAF